MRQRRFSLTHSIYRGPGTSANSPLGRVKAPKYVGEYFPFFSFCSYAHEPFVIAGPGSEN